MYPVAFSSCFLTSSLVHWYFWTLVPSKCLRSPCQCHGAFEVSGTGSEDFLQLVPACRMTVLKTTSVSWYFHSHIFTMRRLSPFRWKKHLEQVFSSSLQQFSPLLMLGNDRSDFGEPDAPIWSDLCQIILICKWRRLGDRLFIFTDDDKWSSSLWNDNDQHRESLYTSPCSSTRAPAIREYTVQFTMLIHPHTGNAGGIKMSLLIHRMAGAPVYQVLRWMSRPISW